MMTVKRERGKNLPKACKPDTISDFSSSSEGVLPKNLENTPTAFRPVAAMAVAPVGSPTLALPTGTDKAPMYSPYLRTLSARFLSNLADRQLSKRHQRR